MIANGDTTQSAVGVITADELGIRQQAAVLSAIELGDGNDVNHFAAVNQSAVGVLVFHDLDGLSVNTVSAQTIDTVAFAATDGASTAGGDILLKADGFLTLERPVNAGTADLRLIAQGDISQSITGVITADGLGVRQEGVTVTAGNDTDLSGGFDILLGGRGSVLRNNDVNTFAAFNGFSAGTQVSHVVFNDVDAVDISATIAQSLDGIDFAATVGIEAVGDKSQIEVVATGTITILNDIRAAVDAPGNTETTIGDTGETIHVLSIDGNINVGTGVTISTDENSSDGVSSTNTGDAIVLVADFNRDGVNPDTNNDGMISPAENLLITQGKVTFGNDVTLRTDGGVAKQFAPRSLPGVGGTAFFDFAVHPLPSIVAQIGINYSVTFSINIGVAGEENLRLDIDWRDPSTGAGDTPDLRLQSLYFDHTLIPHAVTHDYSFLDFKAFVDALNPIFNVDFSVSQHQSIRVEGGAVQQGPDTAPVPGGRISSTDDIGTGTAGPFTIQAGVDRTVATVTNNVLSNADFHLENGLVRIITPTIFLAPVVPDPPRLAPPAFPVAVPNVIVAVLVNVDRMEVVETQSSSFSTRSADFFQLRDGVTGKVIDGYVQIKDEFGELLLQPARLKQWVTDEHLQDQTDLELWLITRKQTGNGPVTIERPVLKFDIADGRPFPASELMPEAFEELQLLPLPLDDNLNDQSSPTPEGSAAPIDGQIPETESLQKDADNNRPNSDGQSRILPGASGRETTESDDEPTVSATSATSRSILTSVAVAAVLNKSRVNSIGPSKSRQLLSRMLNRQG